MAQASPELPMRARRLIQQDLDATVELYAAVLQAGGLWDVALVRLSTWIEALVFVLNPSLSEAGASAAAHKLVDDRIGRGALPVLDIEIVGLDLVGKTFTRYEN